MLHETCRFSVIVVTLNTEESIGRTISSILSQQFKNYEVIVIDGLSSDKTLDVIDSFKFNNVIVRSEVDNGIYDAMNKGIELASGEYLYFLNSGDYFFSDKVLLDINEELLNKQDPDLLYGDVILYDGESERYFEQVSELSKKYFIKKSICHQAVFSRKSLFEEYGSFDTKFKLRADYVWLAALYTKNKIEFNYFKYPICFYKRGGASAKLNWYENLLACSRNFDISVMIRYRYLPYFFKRIKKIFR